MKMLVSENGIFGFNAFLAVVLYYVEGYFTFANILKEAFVWH